MNSGIRNGGRAGPGLNIGRVEPDLGRCLWSSRFQAAASASAATTPTYTAQMNEIERENEKKKI